MDRHEWLAHHQALAPELTDQQCRNSVKILLAERHQARSAGRIKRKNPSTQALPVSGQTSNLFVA